MTACRTVAVLATAVALLAAGCRDASTPDALARAAPSHAGSTVPVVSAEHHGWPVTDRTRVDVDGDGVPDQLRLRAREWPGHGDPLQVVVTLADGTTSVTDLRHEPFAAVFRTADIDRHPGDEIFLLREYPHRTFAVLTWRAGRFVEIRTPRHRPLTDDYWHRQGTAWWVERGHVVSTRSDVRFHFTYDTVEAPPSYVVHAWRWTVSGLRLTPHPIGRFCVRSSAQERLRPC